jgi:hypothetical protein
VGQEKTQGSQLRRMIASTQMCCVVTTGIIQLKSYAVAHSQGTQAGDSEPGFRDALAVNTERNSVIVHTKVLYHFWTIL